MENYISIHFDQIDSLEQDILIAQLSQIGFEGFEQTPDSITAFIPEKLFDEKSFQSINGHHQFVKSVIPSQNWNDVWEKSFEPVIVGNFCSIRASFHPPIHHTLHDLVITPKMSFGTGHHATTLLMVRVIQTLDLRGKSVLDFGTGTGVLAVLAEQCGAEHVLAIDNDPWSINNATENVAANNCKKVTVQHADTIPVRWGFDVILANINKHVINQQLPQIAQHLKDDGVLVLSGLLKGDREEIEKNATLQQLKVIAVKEEKEWIVIVCRH